MKNTLVFVPAVANHSILDQRIVVTGLITFIMFSLTASSIYVLNDILDFESDRIHPVKRLRPIAAGQIKKGEAQLVSTALLVFALIFTYVQYLGFFLLLVTYFALNIAYSIHLKRIPILDVIVLALMYECRIFAGAVMFDINISNWLLSSSALFFLSLAFSKRYAELSHSIKLSNQINFRRGYLPEDLRFLESFGAACGLSSVTTFALYLNDDSTKILYSNPSFLFLLVFILIYLIGKRWMQINRGESSEDPLLSFFSDRSLVVILPLSFLIFFFAI